jgi:hypothetical protein
MARANTVLDDWMDYWGTMGREFADRLLRASRDLGTGEYTFSRFVGDTMAMWQDGMEFWWGGPFARRFAGPVVVFFRILPQTEFKTRTVRVAVPGDAPPQSSDLDRVGGGGRIPKDHVHVEVSDARDEITVGLRDLSHLTLSEGMYLGVVHSDERLVAVVNALVTG